MCFASTSAMGEKNKNKNTKKLITYLESKLLSFGKTDEKQWFQRNPRCFWTEKN